MTLDNMRQQGVRGPAVYCLNHTCRHLFASTQAVFLSRGFAFASYSIQ